jgi:predicted house-cleaning noncanonical NTP pyrophosphatase (MazG superfamily)
MNIDNPIENSGEFSSTHTYEDDNLKETLKQYYECMIAQVQLK